MRSPRREATEATQFRALAARENFFVDRQAGYSVRCERSCAVPCPDQQGDWTGLKRLARYLLEKPRKIWKFGGEFPQVVDVFVDCYWAGCRVSRKSTSGGVVAVGRCLLQSWSSTQKFVAASSGEAEYYALTKAAEGFGVQAVAVDMGWYFKLQIWVTRRLPEPLRTGQVSANCHTWKSDFFGFKRLCEMVGGRLGAPSANRRWADMTDDVQFEQSCVSFFVAAGMRPRAGERRGFWQRERETHPLIPRTSVVD